MPRFASHDGDAVHSTEERRSSLATNIKGFLIAGLGLRTDAAGGAGPVEGRLRWNAEFDRVREGMSDGERYGVSLSSDLMKSYLTVLATLLRQNEK